MATAVEAASRRRGLAPRVRERLALVKGRRRARPPARALPFGVWTSARLAAYLADQTGVRRAPGWRRAPRTRRRFARGRPKHALGHPRDPEAVAACEQTPAEVGGR